LTYAITEDLTVWHCHIVVAGYTCTGKYCSII